MPTLPHAPGAGLDDDWFVNLYKGNQMVRRFASAFHSPTCTALGLLFVQAEADVLQLLFRCHGTMGRSRTLSSRPFNKGSWSRRCVSRQRLLCAAPRNRWTL